MYLIVEQLPKTDDLELRRAEVEKTRKELGATCPIPDFFEAALDELCGIQRTT